jgi:hypothetical protein
MTSNFDFNTFLTSLSVLRKKATDPENPIDLEVMRISKLLLKNPISRYETLDRLLRDILAAFHVSMVSPDMDASQPETKEMRELLLGVPLPNDFLEGLIAGKMSYPWMRFKWIGLPVTGIHGRTETLKSDKELTIVTSVEASRTLDSIAATSVMTNLAKSLEESYSYEIPRTLGELRQVLKAVKEQHERVSSRSRDCKKVIRESIQEEILSKTGYSGKDLKVLIID